MSSKLFEMKQERAAAIAKAESLIAAAENAGRALTASESVDVDTAMAEVQDLTPRIATVEKQNTLRSMISNGAISLFPNPAAGAPRGNGKAAQKTVLGQDYFDSFHAWLSSGGQRVDAALYEGSNPAGGFAVPITVDDQIVPLAPQEMAIRRLATVIPTSNDIRIPRKTTFSVAAGKPESGAVVSTFVESEPTLDQFTLSAYMAGIMQKISWELAQDVPAFQAFCVGDMLTAQQQYEEGLYIGGSGNGQAQGLIGNVGAGVSEEPDTNGNLVSIDGTLDLIGSLNAAYHDNASFLMSRPTSIIIRKAQRQANLFESVWTRSNGQDYLHGYPVYYAARHARRRARSLPPSLWGFQAGLCHRRPGRFGDQFLTSPSHPKVR